MPVFFILNSIGYVASVLLGLAYPAYNSIQAIETRTTVDDTQWLTYWLVYSVGTVLEVSIVYPLFKWLPLYHVFKAVGLAWLVLPHFKGAAFIYESGVLPAYKATMKFLEEHSDKVPALKKILPPKNGVAAKLDDLKQSVGDGGLGKIHAQ